MKYEHYDKLPQLVIDKLVSRRVHPTLPLEIYNYTPAVMSLKIDEWPEALQDCRGLILEQFTGEVVGRPFRKLGPWPWERNGMKTLFMAKGLPASGKTTAAKAYMAATPGTKRVNKDDLRAMIDGGKWSSANEKFVLEAEDQLIIAALAGGFHVIVDDTNFAPKHKKRLKSIAKTAGAIFNEITFDLTHVDPEECIKRDIHRGQAAVGEKVIRDMYDNYLRVDTMPPIHNPALSDVILVDVDGTVAEMTNRGPFEWHKVYQDKSRPYVICAVQGFQKEHKCSVVFISARDAVCRLDTTIWLKDQFGSFDQLLMRPDNDTRRDSIVKRELYENYIKGKYNVVAIFDDRPQVIRECWQALGFGDRIFNVGTGREF